MGIDVLNKWTKYWVFWHRLRMQRSFVLDQHSSMGIVANDDRTQGGESIATVEFRPDGMLLTCQLNHNYTWPFYGLTIFLGDVPNGIDFSNYQSILLDIETDGLESKSVRVFLT